MRSEVPSTPDGFAPTRDAALARLKAVRANDYARTRNHLEGAVTRLSPYITHGLLTLPEVLASVHARHPLPLDHRFVAELGWREFFHHVWSHRGEGIFRSLHAGVLPDDVYGDEVPADVREARTGVPVIDQAVRTLYAEGYLHNHARMWLASYLVHVRKVHWRPGADWLYAHLIDGDLASNHLSWQWVAGTGSSKPYLFNAENVARYAPSHWHSEGSVVDTSYEQLDRIARTSRAEDAPVHRRSGAGDTRARHDDIDGLPEPVLHTAPPTSLGIVGHLPPTLLTALPQRTVWLVHPWSLGSPPPLPDGTLRVGVFLREWHAARPWTAARWHFVHTRMRELCSELLFLDRAGLAALHAAAAAVHVLNDPHAADWLGPRSTVHPTPRLFPQVDTVCPSFTQWWRRSTRGIDTVDALPGLQRTPAATPH